jgi:CheY-like chemotaxis protein
MELPAAASGSNFRPCLSQQMNINPPQILLVEDNEDDVFLMQRAMAKAHIRPPVYVATTGQEAIDYLSGSGSFADRGAYPLPHCIFLDLKLPFYDGFEVLAWMANQPALAQIPVLILTSSPEDRDRDRARRLGARAYLVKPPTPQMLIEALQAIPECAPACLPVPAEA